MKKNRCVFKIFMIAIIIITCVVGILWIVIYSLIPPNKNKSEILLKYDGGLLEVVVEYLKESEYENIYFNETLVNNIVEDQTVIKAIDTLFQRNYIEIGKRGNTIYFLRWTRWKDFGAGLVFSINGERPIIDYLVKLEPLSENQWYYYEEN